jgi:hypothetical protein
MAVATPERELDLTTVGAGWDDNKPAVAHLRRKPWTWPARSLCGAPISGVPAPDTVPQCQDCADILRSHMWMT